MCGIAGILGRWEDRVSQVQSMTSCLAHRGPDGEGLWDGEVLTLGHRRLAVVDLSPAGAQPMHRGPFTVVFNGEVYNWRRLRSELESEGCRFQTQCDTEVLLALYERHGIDGIRRIEGMFAFALWDAHRGILHLVRDRHGVKPLLYADLGGAVAFASELRSFEGFASLQRLDRSALASYLATTYIPAPLSIRDGVRRLEPGTRLELRPGSGVPAPVRWHDPVTVVDEQRVHSEVARRRLPDVLADAVELRLEADVPVGVFLSGGIDSSIVAALAAERHPGVTTLTVGYEDAPELDEREAARSVASALGTDHREIVLTTDDAERVVHEVLDRIDEPFADDSLLPTYLVSRSAREQVTVALSGDGGDELFGGYTKYLGHRWSQVPGAVTAGRLLGMGVSTLPEARARRAGNAVRVVRRFAQGADRDPVAVHLNWVNLLDRDAMSEVCRASDRNPMPDQLGSLFARTAHWPDLMARTLMADVGFVLPHDMLEKVDRASMWNSLEVRSPFLDSRVLPLAFSFPGSSHVGLTGTKQVLRSLFADRLPRSTIGRRKRGFGIPLGEWMRGRLEGLVTDTLSPGEIRSTGILDPDAVERVVRTHLTGARDRSWELWALIVLQTWARRSRWTL